MINAILGRLDVFGTIVEFTRQEAAIVHCLQESAEVGCTSAMMSNVLFGENHSQSRKTLGVHMVNVRRKLPAGVSIVFDAMRNVYVMGEK
jgi:DNA-binding response OmpR family regulator